MIEMIKVGVVVQRYGREVVGGAETLAREVAERLNAGGFDVTVFTTTALDYITWKNHYPAGESILKGVAIKRYPVERERDIAKFNALSEVFFQTDPEIRSEKEWILEQGPYCPGMIQGLHQAQQDFDIFLFFTYLYYPTVEGVGKIEKPMVLFPTAHDEPPIYLKVMKEVFDRPDAQFFLTGAEMEFVKGLFGTRNRQVLVRTGIDVQENVDDAIFRKKYLQFLPYILYAGRIERGKGLETVLSAYQSLQKERLVDLVLIGKKLMDIPEVDGIKYMGYVSEEEKLSAFRGAVLSVQPSPLESLSITTLESFSQRTPVLVNRKSAVLTEHVELSGGGFSYSDEGDFVESCLTLYDNRSKNHDMGKKGHQYVRQYFSWEVVMTIIRDQIRELVRKR